MAESIKQYWRSVRSIAASLDPEAAKLDHNEEEREMRVHLERSQKEIWLVSKHDDKTGSIAGKVVSAHPWIAARWLKEQSHELATSDQVAAYKVDLAQRKEQIEKDEADRKGVPTSKLLEKLTEAMTEQAGGRKGVRGE